jgi:peptidoglycan/LPS O-acetylase OafA/YrhL
MQFVFCMVIGSILAFNVEPLKRFYARVNRDLAVATAVIVLLASRSVTPNIQLSLVVESLASSVIIFVVYYYDEGPVQRFCNLPVVKFYGKISYSFYVNSLLAIHLVGLLAAHVLGHDFLLLHGLLGGILVTIGAIALATPLSWLTYAAIELPLMKLGRRWGSAIARIGSSREPKLAVE